METIVPDLSAWQGYEDDIDSRYAFNTFFGKSLLEVQPLLKINVIERADEIRFMPVKAFQYYIFSLRDFILNKNYFVDEADCAVDSYFTLIQEKLNLAPDAILPIIDELLSSLHFIAENIADYNINEDIYGSIPARLQQLLHVYQRQVER